MPNGCRLVSGTPLHSYVSKLASGYWRYITQTTPLNGCELDRWLSTPLGVAVRTKLRSKTDIAWAGGVPRALMEAGRVIKKKWVSWDSEKGTQELEMKNRLHGFLRLANARDPNSITVLMKACETMFLGGREDAVFDVELLSTSLFYGGHNDVGVPVAVPFNIMAEKVLWAWWAERARDTMSRRLATAMEQLQDPNEEARGYALQTVMRHAILTNVKHEHKLRVHRAIKGKPSTDDGWGAVVEFFDKVGGEA